MGNSAKQSSPYRPLSAVLSAGQLSVYGYFSESVRRTPDKLSLSDKSRLFTYAQSQERVDALAQVLLGNGIKHGDRVAVLSENCIEYIELHLAAASIGAIVACQNWRLHSAELAHCVSLVSPSLLIYSERFAAQANSLPASDSLAMLSWQDCAQAPAPVADAQSRPELRDNEVGLLILYTSGTTGPAKAAVISQRALIARSQLLQIDLDVDRHDGFVAWSPMFHMGGTEHSLSTLMIGGSVFVADGFDVDYIARLLGKEQLGWLLLVPATIERLVKALDDAGITARGVKRVGAMADLLPKHQVAQISARLNAPFLNTFGATETGIAPASRGTFAPGELPQTLSKELSSLCALRLVDDHGEDVEAGMVGEAAVKGPTLFSGYWENDAANTKDFFNGWFRMGDLFRRTKDGRLDFCGRAKYLIKSGGENIYPAEIEAVLMTKEDVKDAIVVSWPSDQWGEVPIAVLAAIGDLPTLKQTLTAACREQLATYKCPKDFVFIDFEDLPRSSSGKIVRQDVEDWLREQDLVQIAS